MDATVQGITLSFFCIEKYGLWCDILLLIDLIK